MLRDRSMSNATRGGASANGTGMPTLANGQVIPSGLGANDIDERSSGSDNMEDLSDDSENDKMEEEGDSAKNQKMLTEAGFLTSIFPTKRIENY